MRLDVTFLILPFFIWNREEARADIDLINGYSSGFVKIRRNNVLVTVRYLSPIRFLKLDEGCYIRLGWRTKEVEISSYTFEFVEKQPAA